MTRTRYGLSPWIDEFPKKRRPDFPRFRGDVETPVVIIGGGLSGVFTAYACAAAGIKAMLLEAERLGHAGAGRGPGVLHAEPVPSYRDIEAQYGRRAARAMFDASRRAVLDLAAAARRLGVTQIDTHDALRLIASFGADEKGFSKEVALRREAGLEAMALKTAAVVRDSKVESARAGVRLRGWGHTDPYRLLATFAKAAADRGATLFERSLVRRVKTLKKHVEIHVEGGVVRAQTVVVCTGEPTELYRPLQRHVRRDERYVALTERLPAAIRKQVVAGVPVVTDTDSPPHVIRWLDDGRALIAGADQPRPPDRAKEKVVVQRTGQLMYELSRMFPPISGVQPAYGWQVPLGVTADGVMFAGPHRNYPRHLFVWATRHDPAQSFLASRVVLRHLLGAPDRYDPLFAFTRG